MNSRWLLTCMKLDQIKNMQIPYGTMVELLWEDKTAPTGRGINPVYYVNLIEEMPEMFRDHHKTPPYVRFAFGKDKNASPADIREFTMDEILKIEVHGPSKFSPP